MVGLYYEFLTTFSIELYAARIIIVRMSIYPCLAEPEWPATFGVDELLAAALSGQSSENDQPRKLNEFNSMRSSFLGLDPLVEGVLKISSYIK